MVRKKPTAKRGMLIINLLNNLPCLNLRKSAIIKRALRKAVSPEVIGAPTTPNNAKAPPIFPSRLFEISFTTNAAFPLLETMTSFNSPIPP